MHNSDKKRLWAHYDQSYKGEVQREGQENFLEPQGQEVISSLSHIQELLYSEHWELSELMGQDGTLMAELL